MKLFFIIPVKAVLTAFMFTAAINCLAQKQQSINVTVTDVNRNHDTLILRQHFKINGYHGSAEKRYPVINGKLVIKDNFAYPKMYFIGWGSEDNNIIHRGGEYFIDATTTAITLDSVYAKSSINGRTADEFKKEFCPFILSGKNETNFDQYLYDHEDDFDLQLAQYTAKHPGSYVALWFLIWRFNESGFKSQYDDVLQLFSKKIKKGTLWATLEGEFKKIHIREGQKFPALALQNISLEKETLSLPVAKYTLIDFWFSRCKPCLAQMPAWRVLYDKYNDKGFTMINISTDRTKDVALWQKRIVERGMVWKNYLDENAVEADAEKLYTSPTNFLLDKNGVVIKKNISAEELEKLLSETL